MSTMTPRPMTLGALIQRGRGVVLKCACGHKTALLPEQFAKLAHPQTRTLDFKRRFRCSMCGRSGASDEIKLSTFAVPGLIGEQPNTQPRSER